MGMNHEDQNTAWMDRIAVAIVVTMLPLGLVVLYGQLRSTVFRNDDRTQPARTAPVVARRADRKPAPGPGRAPTMSFLERLREKVNSRVTAGSSGPATGTSAFAYPDDFSPEARMAWYKEIYRDRGITNHEYVTMVALEEIDREYAVVLRDAQIAFDGRDFVEARSQIEQALSRLRPEHHLGRMRLLDLLYLVNRQEGKVTDAGSVLERVRSNHLEIASITVRALTEAGVMDPAEGDQYLQGVEFQSELAQDMNNGAHFLTPEGTDPEEAPAKFGESISAIIDSGVSLEAR